jgi:hypothetical protein
MALPTVTIQSSVGIQISTGGVVGLINALMTVDGTVGALPNDIPASVFGLRKLLSASAAVKSDNTLVVACGPAYDQASLLGKAAASAAPANIPAGQYAISLIGT